MKASLAVCRAANQGAVNTESQFCPANTSRIDISDCCAEGDLVGTVEGGAKGNSWGVHEIPVVTLYEQSKPMRRMVGARYWSAA